MNTTDVLAWYGTIVASLTGCWTIYRDLLNRGRLRVDAYLGMKSGPGRIDPKDHLVYSITNIGRRSIYVTRVGGAQGNKTFTIPDPSLPKCLYPGEFFEVSTKDLDFLNQELHCLAAWDSLGKIYKVKRKVAEYLIKRVEATF